MNIPFSVLHLCAYVMTPVGSGYILVLNLSTVAVCFRICLVDQSLGFDSSSNIKVFIKAARAVNTFVQSVQ